VANVTVAVPDELKKRMAKHTDVRWSAVVRSIIEEKLDDLELLERLTSKNKLTQEDVNRLAGEVDEAGGRHAEAMLRETRR